MRALNTLCPRNNGDVHTACLPEEGSGLTLTQTQNSRPPHNETFLRVLRFPPPVRLTFHHHHRLDKTLAIAEALGPNKPTNQISGDLNNFNLIFYYTQSELLDSVVYCLVASVLSENFGTNTKPPATNRAPLGAAGTRGTVK